jgi:hypothetical protein
MRFEDGAPAGPPLPGGIDDANPNSPRLDSPAARFIVARVGTLAIDQAAGWISFAALTRCRSQTTTVT